ncbi:thiazole synthase [Marinomonas agarivorans]|nr:thiazole synthase [Marinomonas agarivorans]
MSLILYDEKINSRLLVGSAQYPSPALLVESVKKSQTEIITVSLRRESSGSQSGQEFWHLINQLKIRVLPNTAGCFTVKEAVTTAHMAREIFNTNWIKLEVIGEEDTLQPNVFALVEAAKILTEDGFKVFPYTTDDLIVANKLLEVGCEVLMPWAAPIGSGRGLNNPYGLQTMRSHFPHVPLIVDAGIGVPSHATQVMELGFDAVLINSAIAGAGQPEAMAEAFSLAIQAGRLAYKSIPIEARDMATPSTPIMGKAFL